MTAQKGKDLLLKVDTDGEGSFTTVAGLRTRSLAFNAATVDITERQRFERSCGIHAPSLRVRPDQGQSGPDHVACV